MKKASILFVFLLVITSNFYSQSKKLTAVELFMALPAEYMGGKKSERNGFFDEMSAESDFLSFSVSNSEVPKIIAESFANPQSSGHLRVFHSKSQTIIALCFQTVDAANSNSLAARLENMKVQLFMLEYKNGKFADVTESILPKITIDEAHKFLTENYEMKNVQKDEILIEKQVGPMDNGVLVTAKTKGRRAVITLKWYKWTGTEFMEAEYKMRKS